MEVTDKFYRQKQPVWRTKVREDLITQESIPMKSSSSETQAQRSNSAVGLHVIEMWVQFPGRMRDKVPWLQSTVIRCWPLETMEHL